MQITLLGTGSSTGTPQLLCNCDICKSTNPKNKRTRFSLLLEESGANLLVDAPFETRLQLLASGIDHLDGVWLTHEHSDHFAGIDDLRIFGFRAHKALPFYCSPTTRKAIMRRFEYLFADNEYRDMPFLDPIDIVDQPIRFMTMDLLPVFHKHGESAVASFRSGDFAFLADISEIAPEEKEKLYNLKELVVSSTTLHEHHKHLTLAQVIALVEELAPRHAVLTHMNHHFDYDIIKKMLPSFIEPGFDGMHITV